MPETVLVVAAHPDDEVLGCGGTICAHRAAGDYVHVLIVAEGITSRGSSSPKILLSSLASSTSNALQLLDVSGYELLGLPDNRLDSIDLLDLVKLIELRLTTLRPSIVYVHHSGDVNIDHRLLHQAVITACRPTPNHCVKRLLSFEVASSTEWQPPGSAPAFQPNWFVDISDQWERKREALVAYSIEMRDWPHARSLEAVEHLARWRGAQVGVKAAEAFCLLRQLV